MRKLASVQKVVSIDEIPGADRIVKATVLGWQMVTQRSNNLKPGDLVTFFEIDSLLPLSNPVFDFLKDPNKPEKTHHRLKTIKLKKQVSQGLILPIETVALPDGTKLSAQSPELPAGESYHYVNENDDLTDLLEITKWEPEIPAQLKGLVKGAFPFFISKTDEIRIQSCPGVLERHKGKTFYISEKIDGSSFTCFFIHNQEQANLCHIKPEDLDEQGTVFGVCSRNMYLTKTEDNSYWKIALKYDIEAKLRKLSRSLAIQGEMYGMGIQKNKLKQPSISLAVFNIKDITADKYLSLSEMEALCQELELPMVPILDQNFVLDHTVEQLVNISMGYSSLLTDKVWREGIVIRPLIEETDDDLGRLSFKVINPEFLLKYDE